MRFIYNGVEMLLTKTNMWKREPVYSKDGTDYLYTKHTLDITAVYNPQATSYANNPNPLLGPTLQGGSSPNLTDTLITRLLMTPNRQLFYYLGGAVALQSPRGLFAAGATAVDAHNGPHPIGCVVKPMGETKTWLVQFQVVTWLSDCTTYTADVDPLASNRWETTHHIDERDMTTLVTTGVAAFKIDSLIQLGINVSADHFRDRVLPAVPLGFERSRIDVTLNQTGDTLTYQVMDRQADVCLGSNIEVGTPAYLGVKQFRSACTVAVAPAEGGKAPGPYCNIACDVQVIGHVAAARADLEIFAIKLAVERMNIKPNPNLTDQPGITSVSVTENFHERSIALRVQGWLQANQGLGAAGLGAIPRNFLGIDRIDRAFPKSANSGLPGGITAQKPYDRNTRGDWNVEAFAQAIQGACCITCGRLENSRCNVNDGPIDDNYAPCAPQITVAILEGEAGLDAKRNRFKVKPNKLTTDYRTRISYGNATGKKAAPVSGKAPQSNTYTSNPPTPTMEVMTLSLPFSTITVEWEAEAAGSNPEYPSPVYGDPNVVLIDWDIAPNAVQPIVGDGEVLGYRATGRYVYAQKLPNVPGVTPLFMGIVPWADIAVGEATLSPSDLVSGVIDPGTSSGGPTGQPVGPNV